MSLAVEFSLSTLYRYVMHYVDIAVFYSVLVHIVIRHSAFLIFLKMFALSDEALIPATCPNA